MDQVDEFLDELAADFTALSKENAALKGKMKMLVQKVDEYRQTEDSMRLALLSAQKLSSQIESEARERADVTVAEAKEYAERLTRQTADSIANEGAKLEEAKKATSRFFDHMRTVCQKQIEFYDKLSQMQLVNGGQAAAKEADPEPVPSRKSRELDVEKTVRAISASAREAVMDEPEEEDDEVLEDDIPEEEEEPTRLYPAGSNGQSGKKRKRSFDDFSFDDDI